MTKGESMLVNLSDKLIRVLPPAMTVMVVLNVCFLGALTYIVQHNLTARNEMLNRIVDNCLVKQ